MATEAVAGTDHGSGRWSLAVLGVALLTAAVVSFAPLVSTSTCSETSDGIGSCSDGTSSLIVEEGAGILAIAMIPVGIAALPVVLRSRWTVWAAAIVLAWLVFLAGSVGLLLIPTAILAWVAAVAEARS